MPIPCQWLLKKSINQSSSSIALFRTRAPPKALLHFFILVNHFTNPSTLNWLRWCTPARLLICLFFSCLSFCPSVLLPVYWEVLRFCRSSTKGSVKRSSFRPVFVQRQRAFEILHPDGRRSTDEDEDDDNEEDTSDEDESFERYSNPSSPRTRVQPRSARITSAASPQDVLEVRFFRLQGTFCLCWLGNGNILGANLENNRGKIKYFKYKL